MSNLWDRVISMVSKSKTAVKKVATKKVATKKVVAFAPTDKKTKKVVTTPRVVPNLGTFEGKQVIKKEKKTVYGKEYVDITVISGEVFRVPHE